MGISDYLGSTKNLVGSACGLAGLGLFFTGVAGPYWPAVVAGLYAAGALVAPPDKVVLAAPEAQVPAPAQLRADLDRLVERVAAHAGRMPPPAMMRFKQIRDTLCELLDRTNLPAADPAARDEVARTIRADLPAGFETYLNLPGWFAAGRGGAARRTAADELVTQLDLIGEQVADLARRLYERDAQRLRDHTRRLRDRARQNR